MEYTDGFKVIEIKFQGESYNGFYKVTRKGVVTVETRSDIPVKPYDKITIGVEELIVQKVQIFTSRAEITCENPNTSDIVRSNKVLKKLKKSEPKEKNILEQLMEKDTNGESV
jgi:hypothetical protein|tara:strand:- start:317 stop:655 length:339 start_codon:yes stop_codon:yes gene_type:complete